MRLAKSNQALSLHDEEIKKIHSKFKIELLSKTDELVKANKLEIWKEF